MRIFLELGVTCPYKNLRTEPMTIWCVEIDCYFTDEPTAYTYIKCECCEDLIEVVIPIEHHMSTEFWITKEHVAKGRSVSRREIRGMPSDE